MTKNIDIINAAVELIMKAAIKAALMISDTAKLMMSRFLFMMSVLMFLQGI